MHRLVKKQKKSTFTASFLGPSGGTKNETAKSQNQQQRPTRATNKKRQLRLVKQQAYRVGTVAVAMIRLLGDTTNEGLAQAKNILARDDFFELRHLTAPFC